MKTCKHLFLQYQACHWKINSCLYFNMFVKSICISVLLSSASWNQIFCHYLTQFWTALDILHTFTKRNSKKLMDKKHIQWMIFLYNRWYFIHNESCKYATEQIMWVKERRPPLRYYDWGGSEVLLSAVLCIMFLEGQWPISPWLDRRMYAGPHLDNTAWIPPWLLRQRSHC